MLFGDGKYELTLVFETKDNVINSFGTKLKYSSDNFLGSANLIFNIDTLITFVDDMPKFPNFKNYEERTSLFG